MHRTWQSPSTGAGLQIPGRALGVDFALHLAFCSGGVSAPAFCAASATPTAISALASAVLRTRRVQALTQILRETDVLHIQAVGISCLDGFVAAALSRTKALIVTHHSTMNWVASRRDLLSDVTFWIETRMA